MKLKNFLIFSFFSLCISLVPKVNALDPFEEELRSIFADDRKMYDSITDIFEGRLDKNSLISGEHEDYQYTLLQLLAANHLGGLRYFMKKYPDVDVNALDSCGETALDHAITIKESVWRSYNNAEGIEFRLRREDRVIELLRSAGGKTSKELAQIKFH